MTTVQILERLVPDGVRVRPVAGGYIVSDGQWTTHIATDDLSADDEASLEASLGDRVRRALATLQSARIGDDVSPAAERSVA